MKCRLFCFGSHLLVSLLVAVVSLLVVFGVWYPSPLDAGLGVASIFMLLLCIDVVIGPLLTLVVARQGKKTLKADLAVIALLQVTALAYGLYTVAQGRPVWLVYDHNRFEVVQAYEAVTAAAAPDAPPLTFTGPQWAAVTADPAATANRDAFLQQAFLRGYGADAGRNAQAGAHAVPLAVLQKFNDPAQVDALLRPYPAATGYIPMIAKEKTLVVLVNKADGLPIAIVDLRPW